MQQKNIALVYGGDSSEWEISVLSGKNMAAHINRERYRVFEILLRGQDWRVVVGPDGSEPEDGKIDKNDFSCLWKGEKVLFHKAFIMIHGTPGENGLLPSYFELLELPHTCCSAFTSALAFNKHACKGYLRDTGIQMPKGVLLQRDEEIDEAGLVAHLGLPLFVKPNSGGSSFGVSKVRSPEALKAALDKAFAENDEVLAEEYIEGRELTNGYFGRGNKGQELPVTEIVSHNEFFDFQAKYQGESQEITPAPITEAQRKKVQETTAAIFHYLHCSGFVRVDYMLRGDDLYFLEVNTIPGMTKMSLVPQQLQEAGLSIEAFIDWMLED